MHVAPCRCGALSAHCSGSPIRVSVCHCSACQRRTGSAFSAQARFLTEAVRIDGEFQTFERTADSGRRVSYRFCPTCGTTVAYSIDVWPGVLAIPLGLFDDTGLPAPSYSIYERSMHPWVAILSPGTEHHSSSGL